MKIIFSDTFLSEFKDLLDYISQTSQSNALNFQKDLKNSLEILKLFPEAYRTNQQAGKGNVRNFIFKGFTVPYLLSNDEIILLGIYKQNLWNLSDHLS